MPSNNTGIVTAIKKFRRGRELQLEAQASLRELLPNTPAADLETVAATIEGLLPDETVKVTSITTPAETPSPAKRGPGRPKGSANKAPVKAKAKPFNREAILEALRTIMKGETFQATDLAKECKLPNAQPLSPLLNSLRKRKAVKRIKKKDGIYWQTIPAGLKVYIKEVREAEAA